MPKQPPKKTAAHATVRSRHPSPVGDLHLLATDSGLAGIYFCDRLPEAAERIPVNNNHPVLKETATQLEAYFEGGLRNFYLTLDTEGTDFQKSVWDELQKIPFGKTVSYGAIAEAIGNPKAVRAVGLANGSNPVSIVVPCHRVIGADGSLTGYGGGLDRKRQLLSHEQGGSLF